jgi:hypothetical protein
VGEEGSRSVLPPSSGTSETSVDNIFIRQYIPEDNSEHHTRRRENLKSHKILTVCILSVYLIVSCT